MVVVFVLQHAVSRCGDRLAKQDLSDIDGNVFLLIDGFRNLRRGGRKFAVAFCAVTVKLYMRQVQGGAF